jgi:hypothetical protein
MGTAATTRRVSAAIAFGLAVLFAVATALSGAGVARSAGDAVTSIDVLSNRADLISGGDALVAVELAPGTDPASVKVVLNGTDVTSLFAARPNGSFAGVVTGLVNGKNILTARGADGHGRKLTITNHPLGGPVFAGPQVTPYYCNPNAANPPLGAATDAQCNAPTRVDLLYRNLSNQFVAYDPASPPSPASIQNATFDGKTVPFIVQRVTGTADRGIYQIAVIVDPTKPIEPWSTAQPWAHKLFYPYGGACGTQHNQTAPTSALQATQLGAGFAVASSSLNIYANNCSDVISAEATMMVKEIVVERYGKLRYTMGNGGSAASMQQHLIATNYPGLLDGLTTSQVFPDHMDQVMGSLDCRLLMHYFWPSAALNGSALGTANPLFATAAARLPVWGSTPSNGDNLCSQKVQLFGADRTELVPGSNVACGLQAVDLWSLANPTGERCGIFDFMRSIFGAVPAPDATKGRGRSASDNVGVQYGLKALQAGQITPAQFVDLNSKVGGIDIDGNFTPERKAADPAALEIMYSTGRMNDGSGMKDLPEIDDRTGAQMDDTGFHPAMESFAYRARLDRTNGQHDTEILRLARPGSITFPSQFELMRQWLDNLAADTSGDPQSVKVRRAKPTGLQDGCYVSAAAGGFLPGDFTCGGVWQYYGAPRQVAGGPLASDVMKCQLKPLVRSDYAVTFTDEQWAALQATFPTGVCDYSKPGVSQQGPKATWLTFANGPGGEPLGAAPTSQPYGPPVTTAVLLPAAVNGWYHNPTVMLSASESYVGDGTGLASTEYRLDNGAWTTYSVPFTIAGDGSHSLEYRSTDAGGNVEATQSQTVKIDTTAPTLTVPAAVTANATSPTGAAVTFTVSATDALSGAETPVCSPASGSQFAIGETTVTCSVSDVAGNAAVPKSFVVTVKGAGAQLDDQLALVTGSFASQLASVKASLERGSTASACNQLGAYANHVRAQSGKQIPAADAAALVASAEQIAAVMGC